MAESAADLLIIIDAATEGLRREMSRAGSTVGTEAGRINRQLKSIDLAMAGVNKTASLVTRGLGSLGVAFGAQQLLSFGKRAIDAAGGLGELAQQLGVSTGMLQTLQFAAGQAGVSTSELETGLSRLTRQIGEAADGNKQALASFNELGVGVLDSGGKIRSTDEIVRDLADALKKIDDSATRFRLGSDLLGRTYSRLDTIFTGGADGIDQFRIAAERLGIVLSEEMIAKADEASDKIAEWQTIIEKFATVLIIDVLDDVQEFGTEATATFNQVKNALTDMFGAVDAGGFAGLKADLAEANRASLMLSARSREIQQSLFGGSLAKGLDTHALQNLFDEQDQMKAGTGPFGPSNGATRTVNGMTETYVNGQWIQASDDGPSSTWRRRGGSHNPPAKKAGGGGGRSGAGRNAAAEMIADLQAEEAALHMTNLEREIAKNLRSAETTAATKLGATIVDLTTQLHQETLAMEAANAAFDAAAEKAADMDQARADAAERGRDIVKSQDEFIAGLKAEATAAQQRLSLAGADERTRDVELKMLDLRNQALEQFGGLTDPAAEAQVRRYAEQLVNTATAQEEVNRQTEQWKEIANNAIEGVQDAFGDMFRSILGGGVDTWKELFGTLKTLAIDTLSEIAGARIFKPIVSSVEAAIFGQQRAAAPGSSGGIGGIGGVLGGLGQLLGLGGGGPATSSGPVGALISGLPPPLPGGGALGGLAGIFGIGSALFGGIGLLSGLFGGKKKSPTGSAKINFDPLTGEASLGSTKGKIEGEAAQGAKLAIDMINGFFDELGGQLGPGFSGKITTKVNSQGTRYGYAAYGPGGLIESESVAGNSADANQGSAELAAQKLLFYLLKGAANTPGGLIGVDPIIQSIAKAAPDLDTFSDKLDVARTIFKELAPETNTFVLQLRALSDAFDEAAEDPEIYGKTLKEIRKRQKDMVNGILADQIAALKDPLAVSLGGARDEFRKVFEEVAKVHGDTGQVIELYARRSQAALVQAAEAQATEIQGIVDNWDQLRDTLADFRKGLLLDPSLSPLTPRGKYDEASRQFQNVARRARLGDTEAIADLPDASRAMLEASRSFFASGEQYTRDFGLVQQTLSATESLATRQITIQEKQLQKLEEIGEKFGEIQYTNEQLIELLAKQASFFESYGQGQSTAKVFGGGPTDAETLQTLSRDLKNLSREVRRNNELRLSA